MSLLVRVARQAELAEGSKIVKETHGRKILLARTRGQVYATDAHCFHMGGNLWEGDIEDIGGHACVVCPLHRYKIDMATGQKVDTMLDGCVVCSPGQQQRTYQVRADPDFIWIDIPELHAQAPLPSDRYNQVAAPQPQANRGLFGASSRQPGQAEGLAPYSGFPTRRDLVPDTPSKDAAMGDEPALQLSQEAGVQLSQEAPQQQQQQQQAHYAQSHIPFAQSRVDTARIARRKAATAAIMAKSYMPPSAPPPQAPPARGLFSSGPAPPAPQQQQQQAQAPKQAAAAKPLARQASGQQSLLAFGFTRQPTAAAGGPEAMDME